MQTQPATKAAVTTGRQRRSKAALAGTVELAVLRMANRLGLDAKTNPEAAKQHSAYVNGAIALAITMGILTEERALALRAACGELIGGVGLPATSPSLIGALRGDSAYARIVVAVRRHGGATATTPVELAELGTSQAREMLDRMQRHGVIKAPDMFGHYAIATVEH